MIQRLITTAIFTGFPFGFFMGLFFTWRYGVSIGLASGVACGLLFGVAISIFVESQKKKMESRDGIFEGEAVIRQGPANHFLKGEGRGGWLTLLPTRLVFRSHGSNIQNQKFDLAIQEIASATPALTSGFIPNGLRIIKKNGEREFFVVSNRKDWANFISLQISAKSRGQTSYK